MASRDGRDWTNPVYIKWRRDVRNRDNRTCQMPNCKCKSKLQTHHIIKWATQPRLRFVVSNGITLCRAHHESIKGKEECWAPYFIRKVALNVQRNS
jgi:hypothetical protein